MLNVIFFSDYKLINILKVDPSDQFLKKVNLKTNYYSSFSLNVTQSILSQHNITCSCVIVIYVDVVIVDKLNDLSQK